MRPLSNIKSLKNFKMDASLITLTESCQRNSLVTTNAIMSFKPCSASASSQKGIESQWKRSTHKPLKKQLYLYSGASRQEPHPMNSWFSHPRFLIKVFTLILALLIGLGWYIWNVRSDLALKALYKFYVARSGLHEEVIMTPGGVFKVYTGGNPQSVPVLMIHGFGDNRVSFGQVARYLVEHRRLILPDVPGFGDSPQDPHRKHGISDQVESMRALLNGMGVRKVALVGNSMGGHISAAFTLKYPEMVERLVLINAAGLKVDDPSPYGEAEKPLATSEDFDMYMSKIFFKRPWIPEPFKANFIARASASFDWLNRLRREIKADPDYILNDRIHAITVPTLVLWGRHDKIISPAHAEVWHEKIKGSQLVIWDDAGHSPQYEHTERTGVLLQEFLR